MPLQPRLAYLRVALIGLGLVWALAGCAWITGWEPEPTPTQVFATPTPVVVTAELKAGCAGAVYMRDYLDASIEYLYEPTGPEPYLDEAAGIEAVLSMRNTGNGWLTELTRMMGELLVEAGEAGHAGAIDVMQSLTMSAWSWTKAYVNDCAEMGAYSSA